MYTFGWSSRYVVVRLSIKNTSVLRCIVCDLLLCIITRHACVAGACPAVRPRDVPASASSYCHCTPRPNAAALATRQSTQPPPKACRSRVVDALHCYTRIHHGSGLGRGMATAFRSSAGASLLTARQLAIVQLPPPGPHLPAVPISTFAFDTTQELLWTGNNHVSTFARSQP
jgi:hypothetical protein